MIHTFKAVGQPMMLDVGSGAVHAIDDIAYDVLTLWNDHTPEEIPALLADKHSRGYRAITSPLIGFTPS